MKFKARFTLVFSYQMHAASRPPRRLMRVVAPIASLNKSASALVLAPSVRLLSAANATLPSTDGHANVRAYAATTHSFRAAATSVAGCFGAGSLDQPSILSEHNSKLVEIFDRVLQDKSLVITVHVKIQSSRMASNSSSSSVPAKGKRTVAAISGHVVSQPDVPPSIRQQQNDEDTDEDIGHSSSSSSHERSIFQPRNIHELQSPTVNRYRRCRPRVTSLAALAQPHCFPSRESRNRFRSNRH